MTTFEYNVLLQMKLRLLAMWTLVFVLAVNGIALAVLLTRIDRGLTAVCSEIHLLDHVERAR